MARAFPLASAALVSSLILLSKINQPRSLILSLHVPSRPTSGGCPDITSGVAGVRALASMTCREASVVDNDELEIAQRSILNRCSGLAKPRSPSRTAITVEI